MDGGNHIARDFLIQPGMFSTAVDLLATDVVRAHRMSLAELKGPRRHAPFVRAREEFAYRASNELGMSTPAIGYFLGKRDHTSILNNIHRYEERMSKEAQSA